MSYFVSYHVEIKNGAGQPIVIDKTDQVSNSAYTSLKENDKVTVVYMPSDATGTARLTGDYGGPYLPWSLAMAGGAIVVVAILGILAMQSEASRSADRPPTTDFSTFSTVIPTQSQQ